MNVPAKVINEKPLDIDGRGMTPVQILDTGFRYPLLARWADSRSPQKRTIWAVAGHFIAHLPEMKNLDAISRVLDRRDLQIRRLSVPDVYRIGPTPTSPDFDSVSKSGEILEKLTEVRKILGNDARVEPDYLYFVSQVSDAVPMPSDEDFRLQTYLQLAKVPDAWRVQKGDRNVRVAIVDTGVDSEHPDLKDNILRDANGAIVGWDYHNGQPNLDDDHGHGTICAGLVGGVGDNGIGITGVNWEVSIMPIKAFDSSGVGTGSHTAAAIHYAIDQKADVILCAWGSSAESLYLKDALKRADNEDILVVAAAGNDPLDLDQEGQNHFPASFDGLDNLISVGGCDDNGVPILQWGHGQKRVHLSAPGVQIYSTVPTRFRPYLPYDRANGTSPAAALVAGACALLRAKFPDEPRLTIRDLLLRGTTPARILDVANAIQQNPRAITARLSSVSELALPAPPPETSTEEVYHVD